MEQQRKLPDHQAIPFYPSSDNLYLSDYTEDDNDSVFLSPSPEKHLLRRSATFTAYQILQSTECEPSRSTDRKCDECLRRDHLLYNEHQRCLSLDRVIQNLTEQLRVSVALNHRYESRLDQYQMSFNRLKEKMVPERNVQTDHLERLLKELKIYNQTIEAREREEMASFFRRKRMNAK